MQKYLYDDEEMYADLEPAKYEPSTSTSNNFTEFEDNQMSFKSEDEEYLNGSNIKYLILCNIILI